MLEPITDSERPTARSRAAQREADLRWHFGDYRRFCGLLEIIPKDGQRCKLTLNKVQREYARRRTARDVVLKARQVTMTTGEQARDVWHFLTHPGARTVLMCQSVADKTTAPSRQLAIRFELMFDALRREGVRLDFKRAAGGFWELGGGSDALLTVVEAGASQAAAEKKGRSGTITRLHATEPAFWEYAADTMNAAMECVPAPAHKSEVVLESTPNGAQGYYYETAQAAAGGRSPFTLHFYPWYWCEDYQTPLEPGERIEPLDGPPGERERQLLAQGVTREQLKWRRLKLGEKGGDLRKLDQEYPSDPDTCFLVEGLTFFDKEILLGIRGQCFEPGTTRRLGSGILRIWYPPVPGEEYVLGADTSEGLDASWDPLAELAGQGKISVQDGSSGIVRERRTGRHMATLWGMWRPWDFAGPLAAVGKLYNGAYVAVERNNHGHTTLRALENEQRYRRIFHDVDERPGWLNVQPKRMAALGALETAYRRAYGYRQRPGSTIWEPALTREERHRASEIDTPDRALSSQMQSFVVRDGKAQAAKGAHDDLVIADAIAWDLVCRTIPRRDFDNLPHQ